MWERITPKHLLLFFPSGWVISAFMTQIYQHLGSLRTQSTSAILIETFAHTSESEADYSNYSGLPSPHQNFPGLHLGRLYRALLGMPLFIITFALHSAFSNSWTMILLIQNKNGICSCLRGGKCFPSTRFIIILAIRGQPFYEYLLQF